MPEGLHSDESPVAPLSVAQELDRKAMVEALDAYLAELAVELGPLSAEEAADAEQWAEKAFGE